MKSKHINNIVSLLVWLTLVLAIVLAITSYKESKSFEDFSKNARSSKLLFEIKKQIIYKKSNFGKVTLKGIKKDILSNKDDEKLDDKKALLETDSIRKFIKTVNSKTSDQELQALLALAENEAKNIDILDEVEANGYSNYLTSKTIVIAVILGFLSIFFVIKIELHRLHNERKHYREQAKDNVADILNYSMNLMEDIDRKHVDFMYSLKEINTVFENSKERFNISKLIDFDKSETKPEYYYLRKLYSMDTTELSLKHKLKNIINKYILKKKNNTKPLEESVYFSTAFVRLLINDKTLRKELCGDENNDKILNELKKLYYSTLAHNFGEYLENSKEDKSHSINEEVDKIPSHIEEIILKKDFEIDDIFAKKYLNIVDSIKNFKNILENNSNDQQSLDDLLASINR